VNWPTIIALAVLAIAAPVGLWGAISLWRLGRDLDREQRNGYRLPPNVAELRDMHDNAVLTRQTALVALEDISTAAKQRGELETAAVADKALRDVYARVR
jgi:hypothetical protein